MTSYKIDTTWDAVEGESTVSPHEIVARGGMLFLGAVISAALVLPITIGRITQR